MSGRIRTAAVVLGIAAATGVALAARRLFDSRLEPWERVAEELGNVGDPEGHDPNAEEPAIGTGLPDEHCVLLGADADNVEPHCVTDPLSDTRFAPVYRGAAASAIPSSSIWPVKTKHGGRLLVSYWTAGGHRGYSGRAFAADREDVVDGRVYERSHAGVDLFARAGDVVVAPENAKVLAILKFNAGTWAVYLRAGGRVVNLGEVEKLSWRKFNISPGVAVVEGQPLARVGIQAEGSTMIHFETYWVGGMTDEEVIEAIRSGAMSWARDQPAPPLLRDPSGYLVMAASRTYRREMSTG